MKRFQFFLYASVGVFVALSGLFAFGLLMWDFYFPGTFTQWRPTGEGAWVKDVGLIIAFGLQHSLMARKGFKKFIGQLLPKPLIRSGYVMASGFMLFLLAALWSPVGPEIWNFQGTPWQWAILGLAAAGLAFAGWGTLLMFPGDLIGLNSIREVLRGEQPVNPEFSAPGPYQIVRHPLYFGLIVMIWAVPVSTVDHLIFAGGLSLYMFVGALFEEKDLRSDFGESYRNYQKKVPMLIPFLKLWGK